MRSVLVKRSHPEVFLGKGVLKICSKFTGEHPCRNVISIKLESNFNWNHISPWVFFYKFAAYFRKPFLKNTSEWLFLISMFVFLFSCRLYRGYSYIKLLLAKKVVFYTSSKSTKLINCLVDNSALKR